MKVLIDNGSNNNFIKPDIAEKLNLKRTTFSEFKVGTGSGAFSHCDSKCEKVTLNIQDHVFDTNLFILEIKVADIVLGVQWLIELGTIMTNYKVLTMQFYWKGKEVKLQGENILSTVPLKGKTLNKMMSFDSISCFFQLQATKDHNSTAISIMPASIKGLLSQFQEVFDEPKTLPPNRDVDHRIPLDPSGKPVSIRPYRYPQFQKIEIERLVGEMQA